MMTADDYQIAAYFPFSLSPGACVKDAYTALGASHSPRLLALDLDSRIHGVVLLGEGARWLISCPGDG